MALLPYLLDYDVRPRRLYDQLFGLNFPQDSTSDILEHPIRHYLRPWRNLSSLNRDVGSTISSDKNKFQLNLDVKHFSPDEISVKTADNYIIVEGKHEERKDEHGYISRQFKRRYALPNECNPEMVESKLSSDGVLTITAPKISCEKDERAVPIIQTGPVRRKLSDDNEVQSRPEDGKTPSKKKKR